jgi:hypothetical protein
LGVKGTFWNAVLLWGDALDRGGVDVLGFRDGKLHFLL